MSTKTRPAVARCVVLPLLLLGASACVPIHLVSDYDEVTDQQVTALQRSVDDSLAALETMAVPLCLRDNHASFYATTYSAIRSLQLRNEARGQDNRQTTEQLALLLNSIQTLEQLHKTASNKTPPTCMAPEAIEADRNGINATFRAILTLELAKKRGAKPNAQ